MPILSPVFRVTCTGRGAQTESESAGSAGDGKRKRDKDETQAARSSVGVFSLSSVKYDESIGRFPCDFVSRRPEAPTLSV